MPYALQKGHVVDNSNVDGALFKNLWSSHWTFSQDERFAPLSIKTVVKTDFVPPQGEKRIPAKPLPPSVFQHVDKEKIYERHSETKQQFYPKTCINENTKDVYDTLYKTTYKPHKDNTKVDFKTSQQLDYYPKYITDKAKLQKKNNRKHSAVLGDPEKIRILKSETT